MNDSLFRLVGDESMNECDINEKSGNGNVMNTVGALALSRGSRTTSTKNKLKTSISHPRKGEVMVAAAT